MIKTAICYWTLIKLIVDIVVIVIWKHKDIINLFKG